MRAIIRSRMCNDKNTFVDNYICTLKSFIFKFFNFVRLNLFYLIFYIILEKNLNFKLNYKILEKI